MVLDPKGPQAERQASDIMLIHWNYVGHYHCCLQFLVIILIKYRASKQSPDYEPPHIEGNPWVETIMCRNSSINCCLFFICICTK